MKVTKLHIVYIFGQLPRLATQIKKDADQKSKAKNKFKNFFTNMQKTFSGKTLENNDETFKFRFDR